MEGTLRKRIHRRAGRRPLRRDLNGRARHRTFAATRFVRQRVLGRYARRSAGPYAMIGRAHRGGGLAIPDGYVSTSARPRDQGGRERQLSGLPPFVPPVAAALPVRLHLGNFLANPASGFYGSERPVTTHLLLERLALRVALG